MHELSFTHSIVPSSLVFLQHEADKRVAFLVHSNWNKQQKKSRMARDRLWFLTSDDKQCMADFDPMASSCHKLCAPVMYSAPGSTMTHMKTCANLNKEDDYQARKHGGRWRANNYTWVGDLRGLFWHPMAYRALPNCARNLSKVGLYAEAAHAKLMKEAWNEKDPGLT